MSILKLKGRAPKATEPKKPAVLIYGEAGSGKTTGALGFPKPFFIDSERGATNREYQEKLAQSGGIYFGVEDGSQNFEEVIDQVRALRSVKHDLKTLVIDSKTKLFNTEIANEQERIRKAGKKDEFGASKKPAVAKSRELAGLISSIDMTVLLLAHEAPNWADGEQKGVKADVWDKWQYELDLVLHIRKLGSARKAFIIKSRIAAFPEGTSFEWNYAEFAKRWGQDVIEREHKPVVLATKEQLERLAKLNDTLKTSAEERDKHLGWADVTRYEDVPTDKMAYIIETLEAKLPK